MEQFIAILHIHGKVVEAIVMAENRTEAAILAKVQFGKHFQHIH